MKVVVCGSRNFTDRERLFRALDLLHLLRPVTVLAEGGASGADRMASDWARARGLRTTRYHADWQTQGKAAGPRRNQRMIDEFRPELVVAFNGGPGTQDLVRRARAAGIEVTELF